MNTLTIVEKLKNDKILLISGTQGMGKSTLAREIRNILENENFIVSLINCERENITPYTDLIKLLQGLPSMEEIFKIVNPSRIIGYFVINTGGVALTTVLTKNESMDSDILAGMITAVRNFISETINLLGLNGLSTSPQIISSAGYSIIVAGVKGGYLATLLSGQPSISTISYVRQLATQVSFKYGDLIEKWSGHQEDTIDLQYFMHKKIDDAQPFYPERGEIVNAISNNLPKDKPIVFMIDDAHWIDPSSLDIISSLRDWGMENIHVIYFFNPNNAEKHESFIKIVERNKNRIFTLSPWNKNVIHKKLMEKYGEQRWLDDLAEKILEKTGGVAILVTEMITRLEEYGVIKKFGEGYIFNRKVMESINSMSMSSVGKIWENRINELPQNTKKILKIFSVIGDAISIDFAVKITKMDEMDIMMALDPAIEKEIVILEDDYIRFKHQGLRKSLYESMNKTQAKVYHRYVAKLMENMNEAPSQIAYHYWEARDKKGVKYLKDAVEMAQKTQSYLEMHKYCSMALDLVTDESDRFYFLTKKAKACNVLGYMNDSLKLLSEAEKIAKTPDDYRDVFNLLSSAYFRMGYYSKVVEAAKKFSPIVGEKNQSYILLEVARAMWRLGNLKRGEEYLEKLLNEEMSDEMAIEVYRLYGVIKTSLHDDKSAEEYYLKSLEIAKRIGDLPGMSAASNNLAIIYVNRGDLEKGEKFYRQSLEFDKKLGDLRGRSLVMINLGELLTMKGQIKEGEKLFREIIEIKKSIGDMEGLGFAYYGLADTLFIQGKYEDSLEYAKMAERSFSEIEYKEGLGFISMLLTRIYFQLGDVNKSFKNLSRSERIYKDLEDHVSLEAIDLFSLELKIKIGEKIEIPELKSEDNGEEYYYLKSLLDMANGEINEALKNIERCMDFASRSKNLVLEKFYCSVREVLKKERGKCVNDLEKMGANHYLQELKYFNLQS